ncbi:MAG: ribbon-helix-helix domain-containing protein [Candidatus Sumerlaeota bacterium]|nr:ribbon-helix-helix domain-containing protein [Candidatus Sumerlaeota bacterium]
MSAARISITIDKSVLIEIDRLVRQRVFRNRSRAIQDAVREKLNKIKSKRLAVECAKLNPEEERALAEEGFTTQKDSWPGY